MSSVHPETEKKTTKRAAEAREKHKKYLIPAVANYYREPVVLDRGEGMYLEDVDGTRYLDFFGGILTVSVGHANEEVNQAVIAQVQRLSHVSTLYPTVPMVELAERLANIAPGDIKTMHRGE